MGTGVGWGSEPSWEQIRHFALPHTHDKFPSSDFLVLLIQMMSSKQLRLLSRASASLKRAIMETHPVRDSDPVKDIKN